MTDKDGQDAGSFLFKKPVGTDRPPMANRIVRSVEFIEDNQSDMETLIGKERDSKAVTRAYRRAAAMGGGLAVAAVLVVEYWPAIALAFNIAAGK